MTDPLVKVVVDCSVPDRDAVVAYTQDQVEAVLKSRTDGKITSEEAAAQLVALADLTAAAAGIPDRVQVVPLDAGELAQWQTDQDAAALAAEVAALPPPPTTAEKVAAAVAAAPELSDATKQALAAALA